jgi:hypothetical protein
MKRSEVEDLRTEGSRGVEELARFARELGYDTAPQQLILSNGCSASGILNMLEDNPGMIRAIYEFALDNDDAYEWEEEEDDEDEEEDPLAVHPPEG